MSTYKTSSSEVLKGLTSLLFASLTISLSFLTHAADVLFIINRLGHLRGRGRLWAEITTFKVEPLISIFDSFYLSDSLNDVNHSES